MELTITAIDAVDQSWPGRADIPGNLEWSDIRESGKN
jgi:hypothetical protein